MYPSYSLNNDQLQFVDNKEVNGETNYVNGSIDQKTLSMSFRLNYTINPNLSIQYWGQPFISRGRYGSFKEIDNPTAKDFGGRFTTYSPFQISKENNVYNVDENEDGLIDFSFDNPDFSFVQFRSNLVLRWEYIPGSEIFLVWSQDISRSANPEDELFSSLGDQIFGDQKPMNIFLLKATYRFVL